MLPCQQTHKPRSDYDSLCSLIFMLFNVWYCCIMQTKLEEMCSNSGIMLKNANKPLHFPASKHILISIKLTTWLLNHYFTNLNQFSSSPSLQSCEDAVIFCCHCFYHHCCNISTTCFCTQTGHLVWLNSLS